MADYAIGWASRNKISVEALFLKSGKEKEEGYAFPSDLDAAEKLKTRKDAEKDDRQLIRDYQKLLTDLGKEKNVQVSTTVIVDPSVDDVVAKTKDATIVFVDASYDPEDPSSPVDFTIEDFQKKSKVRIEVVREP